MKIEVRYEKGNGCEYHLYMNDQYYMGLNREDIIDALLAYYAKKENR